MPIPRGSLSAPIRAADGLWSKGVLFDPNASPRLHGSPSRQQATKSQLTCTGSMNVQQGHREVPQRYLPKLLAGIGTLGYADKMPQISVENSQPDIISAAILSMLIPDSTRYPFSPTIP